MILYHYDDTVSKHETSYQQRLRNAGLSTTGGPLSIKRIIKVINLLLCESTSSSLINQFACSLATSCFDSIMQNQSMNICEHQAVRHLSCATHIQQVRHCIRPWLTNYDSNSLSQSCIKLSSLLIIGTFCQLRFLGTKPCKIRCTHFCF